MQVSHSGKVNSDQISMSQGHNRLRYFENLDIEVLCQQFLQCEPCAASFITYATILSTAATAAAAAAANVGSSVLLPGFGIKPFCYPDAHANSRERKRQFYRYLTI